MAYKFRFVEVLFETLEQTLHLRVNGMFIWVFFCFIFTIIDNALRGHLTKKTILGV